MRKRAFLLLCLALIVPTSQAQHVAAAPWMTGERLLKRLDIVDPADVTWSPKSILPSRQLVAEHRTMMNIEFAQGYIAAVHDATEGKTWCYNEKYQTPNPEAVWDEARWGLRRLPAEQLKRNASDLLSEIWRAKWPCPAAQWRPK